MRKLRTILFLLAALVFVQVQAQQDSSFEHIAIIPGPISYFNVDNLDNIYFITATNQLKKNR